MRRSFSQKGGEMKKVKEALIDGLFLVGMMSCILLGIWIVAAFIYVFDTTVTYPGAIANIPKWVFAGAPLIFLYKTEAVDNFLR